MISCSITGFGFARLRFPGRSFLFFVMLTTLMMPAWVVIVPHFMMFNAIGWLDTFLPINVPSFFGNAFYIFLFRQYFLGIPKELEDAARVDGCSTFRILWQIFLPMSLPVVATVAIFALHLRGARTHRRARPERGRLGGRSERRRLLSDGASSDKRITWCRWAKWSSQKPRFFKNLGFF